MKKIMMLLLVACAAMSVSGQVYVGGTAGFWVNDKDNIDRSSFTIAPEVGYNFNGKWAIGAELGYDFTKYQSDKLNTIFITPYVRFTYYEIGIVRLFLDGDVGFASAKFNDTRTNGFEIGVKPGVALKLNDTFSLISKIGFFGFRDDYYSSNGFGLNVSGTDLRFGLQANF